MKRQENILHQPGRKRVCRCRQHRQKDTEKKIQDAHEAIRLTDIGLLPSGLGLFERFFPGITAPVPRFETVLRRCDAARACA